MALLGVLLVLLLAVGTVGFAVIEGVSVPFAFEWTLDTVATVGSIPNPTEGAARALKVVLTLLGVGTLFYALVTFTESLVAGHGVARRRDRSTLQIIHSLSALHLICGFGRVGRQISRDLAEARQRFVVIDTNPDSRATADERGIPFLEGSASDDEVLR